MCVLLIRQFFDPLFQATRVLFELRPFRLRQQSGLQRVRLRGRVSLRERIDRRERVGGREHRGPKGIHTGPAERIRREILLPEGAAELVQLHFPGRQGIRLQLEVLPFLAQLLLHPVQELDVVVVVVQVIMDRAVVVREGVAVAVEDRIEDQHRVDLGAGVRMVPDPLVGQEHVVVDADQLVLGDHAGAMAAGAERRQHDRQHHDMSRPMHRPIAAVRRNPS